MKKWSRSLGWFTLGALVSGATLVACDHASPDVEVIQLPGKTTTATLNTDTHLKGSASATQHNEPAADAQQDAAPQKDSTNAAQSKPTHLAELDKNNAQLNSADLKNAASQGDAPLLKRLVIANDVKDREPVQDAAARTDAPVVAFLELKNEASDDSSVLVTFEHESGKKVGFIELTVPAESPRYRTWGRTHNISEPGEWTAVVTSKDGKELGRTLFSVAG